MYNSQEIAQRIRDSAANKNIQLKDMFVELNISSNTLHNMKTSMPKADTIAKIADFLGVSTDSLFGRCIVENEKTVRQMIINKVISLPDDKLDRLLGYLEALASDK